MLRLNYRDYAVIYDVLHALWLTGCPGEERPDNHRRCSSSVDHQKCRHDPLYKERTFAGEWQPRRVDESGRALLQAGHQSGIHPSHVAAFICHLDCHCRYSLTNFTLTSSEYLLSDGMITSS